MSADRRLRALALATASGGCEAFDEFLGAWLRIYPWPRSCEDSSGRALVIHMWRAVDACRAFGGTLDTSEANRPAYATPAPADWVAA